MVRKKWSECDKPVSNLISLSLSYTHSHSNTHARTHSVSLSLSRLLIHCYANISIDSLYLSSIWITTSFFLSHSIVRVSKRGKNFKTMIGILYAQANFQLKFNWRATSGNKNVLVEKNIEDRFIGIGGFIEAGFKC